MAKKKQQHTSPCHDCPWRRKSLPGWLGTGQNAEDWLRTAHGEVRVECHIHAPNQCAGISIYRNNVCQQTRYPDVILELPVDKEKVFASPMEFKAHHNKLGFTSKEACAEDPVVKR